MNLFILKLVDPCSVSFRAQTGQKNIHAPCVSILGVDFIVILVSDTFMDKSSMCYIYIYVLKKRDANIYISLDVLLCSIPEYFYELCRRTSQNTSNE